MQGGLLFPPGPKAVVRQDRKATGQRLEKREALTKTRYADNAKDTLCRNVTIYGHCRYENKGTRGWEMLEKVPQD